jgi:hypothetical protein
MKKEFTTTGVLDLSNFVQKHWDLNYIQLLFKLF